MMKWLSATRDLSDSVSEFMLYALCLVSSSMFWNPCRSAYPALVYVHMKHGHHGQTKANTAWLCLYPIFNDMLTGYYIGSQYPSYAIKCFPSHALKYKSSGADGWILRDPAGGN